jgi:hypothetical protein
MITSFDQANHMGQAERALWMLFGSALVLVAIWGYGRILRTVRFNDTSIELNGGRRRLFLVIILSTVLVLVLASALPDLDTKLILVLIGAGITGVSFASLAVITRLPIPARRKKTISGYLLR